ncbi:MAG: TlpA family protein disulfide reductase [Gammaproteobacteria bacterium]|nr:TlpA family protein disulfide reductase [Gammaproteobacteria bacterium]
MKQRYGELSVRNKNHFMKIVLLIVLVFSFNTVTAAENGPPLTHKLTKLKQQLPAPALRLKNMDDEVVDIKDLKGKVVVVNFWATWCPPCRREMSSLERLHLATKEKNVVLLAVNVGEDMDTVFPFLGMISPSPSFPILFDTDTETAKQWQVKGLPTTYIVSPEGKIVYRAIGGREFDHPAIQDAVIKLTK